MRKALMKLWDYSNCLFRIFIYIAVMDTFVYDESINIIWKTIAYITGWIFVLTPLKKDIFEK